MICANFSLLKFLLMMQDFSKVVFRISEPCSIFAYIRLLSTHHYFMNYYGKL